MRSASRAIGSGALALAVACTSAGQDIETPTASATEPPDLTGSYLSQWSEQGDCGALPGAPADFVSGTLEIASTSGALTLDLEEASFAGTIDETFTWVIDGSTDLGGWTVTLTGEGLAYISGALWVLEGDLEMDATNGSESCASEGAWTATQRGAASE